MNDTEAVVVRLEGEHAWVSPRQDAGACGACDQKSGCRMHAAEGREKPLLRLPNPIKARAGDRVIIHAPDGYLLRAVWRAYGIPLVLGLAGAMLGLIFSGSDGGALTGMLLGLMVGFSVLRFRPDLSLNQQTAMWISFKHPT